MSAWSDFPQRLDPLEYRLIIAAAVMIALAAFVASFVFVRRARLIEDTPTSRLSSAALGYVELEGEAVMMAGVPIVAPLTLTPCAWFRYCIEERIDDDKRALGRWCVVDPEGATVMPSVTQVWYGDTASPPPVNLPHPLFQQPLSLSRRAHSQRRLSLCHGRAAQQRRRGGRRPCGNGTGAAGGVETRSSRSPGPLRPQPRRRQRWR